jgi:uncharacterized protein
MNDAPQPRLTVVTLGVADMRASVRFYQALGFARRMQGTGEEVAFFDAGAAILALYPWDKLAADATLAAAPRPPAFRGTTLAWNCASRADVDAALAHALRAGATLLKGAHDTSYGGYSGYFADPDGHPWEVVVAPGLVLAPDGRVVLGD